MSPHGDHVDLDVLADHLERLLDADTAAQVRAHLDACDLCTARADDLRRVSMLLASQPAPSMPEEVRLRVEHALHDARAEQTPLSEARQPEARTTGQTRSAEAAPPLADARAARRRRTRMSTGLLAAAAAVVVVAVGGIVLEGTDGPMAGSAGQGEAVTGLDSGGGSAESQAPRDSGARRQSDPPGVAPRVQRQPSLIEEVYRTRTVTIERERADCVGRALDDPQWVGTSYAVDLSTGPGVVAFLGDADNTAARTTGALIECGPEPTVVRREQLRR